MERSEAAFRRRRPHSKNAISSGVNVEPGPTNLVPRLDAPASWDLSSPSPANRLHFLHDLCVPPFPMYEKAYPDLFLNFKSDVTRCCESLMSKGTFCENFTCPVALAGSCGIVSEKKSAEIARTL